jgi:exo-beta-1,3-glucanase (GH17 family)
MSPTEYLRHPGLLLAAVALAIGLVWFALGYPTQMPRAPLTAGEKLYCLSYAPAPAAVPVERIQADLARLAPHTGCVRTHATGTGLDRVPDIARPLDLQVLQGIALGRDADRNNAEIERAIALGKSHRAVIRAFVVGSGVLSRGELTADELGAHLRRVRTATGVPVTYADRPEAWLNSGALPELVDFVTVHVELYGGSIPVRASEAARTIQAVRAQVATRVGAKDIVIDDAGWPSAGRMRESARPSPANQARVLHDLVAAAKAGNFRISIFEGKDQRWRARMAGTAAAHWGLLDGETGQIKFRWGGAVSDHPLWFYQGLLGVMLAFVTFAASFLAARSLGPGGPARTEWRPVALIAFAAGLFVGWSVAELPLQSDSVFEWAHAALLIVLAVAVPPAAAAALVRGRPIESFAALFDPNSRRFMDPLSRTVTLLLVLTTVVAIELALGFVFDPANRDFVGAPLTGPVVAFLVLLSQIPPRARSASVAEVWAALILAVSAVFIAFNETLWNWQALWFALALLALAAACWLARGARAGQIR